MVNGKAARWAEFGGKLSGFRCSQDLSQVDFALKLGFSPQHQHIIETGRQGASINYINSLISAFGLDKVAKRKWHRLGAKAAGWEIE